MFQSPFSFNGRIRRAEFGLSLIIYVVFYVFLIGIMSSGSKQLGGLGLIFIPVVWFIWAQAAKRCHDLGKSGFWQLIPFYIFWLIFQDGEIYENEYGENPKGLTVVDYSAPAQSPLINEEQNTEPASSNSHIEIKKEF